MGRRWPSESHPSLQGRATSPAVRLISRAGCLPGSSRSPASPTTTRWSWLPRRRGGLPRHQPAPLGRCPARTRFKFLSDLWPRTQERAERSPELLERIEALVASRRRPTSARPDGRDRAIDGPVAFFCAEFGFHASLPLYSGGLGVLAGDILKEASDQALPMIGIGLFYRRGYFRQRIDLAGRQQEYWLAGRPEEPADGAGDGRRRLAARPHRARCSGSDSTFQVWRVDVGRVPLLLLDTELPAERPGAALDDRTALRGEPRDPARPVRRCSGSAARACCCRLGIEPARDPPQRGASRAGAARARRRARGAGRARSRRRSRTLRPSGRLHDAHARPGRQRDVRAPTSSSARSATCRAARHRRRGSSWVSCRVDPGDAEEPPGMTPLALRVSGRAERRQPAARRGRARDVAAAVRRRGRRRMCRSRTSRTARTCPTFLGAADGRAARPAPRRRLGRARPPIPGPGRASGSNPERRALGGPLRGARELVEFIRAKSGAGPAAARRADRLGARGRRVPRGRRAHARLRAPPRDVQAPPPADARRRPRASASCSGDRPVQLLVAGKAHPNDEDGKETLQRIFQLRPTTARCGRAARRRRGLRPRRRRGSSSSGCDVWVNLPRRPMEASGTSGMKATFNGGAAAERARRLVGRGVRRRRTAGRSPATRRRPGRRRRDATRFYDLLEHEVIPLFYDRDDERRAARLVRAGQARARRPARRLHGHAHGRRLRGAHVPRVTAS